MTNIFSPVRATVMAGRIKISFHSRVLIIMLLICWISAGIFMIFQYRREKEFKAQSEYDLLEMTKISGFVDRHKGLGRPTKREGRELSRFKEESYADAFFLDWEDDDDEGDDD